MKVASLGATALLGALCFAHMLVGCGNAEPGSGAAAGGSTTGGATAGGTTAGSATAGNPVGGSTVDTAGSGAGGAPAASGGALLPWAVGNTWTYRVTKNGASSDKVTTIGALEAVGGAGPSAKLMANHVSTTKGAGSSDHTESWQAPSTGEPERILRFRELTYDPKTGQLQDDVFCEPPKLHIDGSAAHTAKGATWLEKYTESTLAAGMPVTSHAVSERWTVIDDNETLTVSAGTFQHVLHLQKVGAASTKDYWYARGVGKLKETGTQTEELVSYKLAP